MTTEKIEVEFEATDSWGEAPYNATVRVYGPETVDEMETLANDPAFVERVNEAIMAEARSEFDLDDDDEDDNDEDDEDDDEDQIVQLTVGDKDWELVSKVGSVYMRMEWEQSFEDND